MAHAGEVAVQVREAAVLRIDHDDVAHLPAQRVVDPQVGGGARRAARRRLAAAERDARAERGEAAEHAAAVGINGKVVGAIGGVVHVVCSSNGRLSFDARQRRTAGCDAGRDATAGVARGAMRGARPTVTQMSRTRL